jgi:hypothetical protein
MLSIYQSHNLSDLFKHLALFLGQKQQNPFQALTILVPSLRLVVGCNMSGRKSLVCALISIPNFLLILCGIVFQKLSPKPKVSCFKPRSHAMAFV